MRFKLFARRGRVAVLVAGLTTAAGAGAVIGSDHQDTPEVELSPRMDINDVYAFPGSSEDRIVLVMTTSSPITPAQSGSASFDPNLLYQIKLDSSGDALEDLVLQFTFSGTGANQRVSVRGPVRPAQTGMINSVVDAPAAVEGPINTNLGSSTGLQVFAGLRDDPFFLDLEQFFRIIPDRRPVSGPLSQIPGTPTATAFRPADQAMDYLRGINTLALIVELPESMLGNAAKLGVWGTISR
jgi:hypothetical protein